MEDRETTQGEQDTIDPVQELQEKLALAEARARNSERLLKAAKTELLLLSTEGKPAGASSVPAPEPSEKVRELESKIESLSIDKARLEDSIERLNAEVQTQLSAVEHWRTRYLQTELDKDSLSNRAELVEEMLSEAVKPLPHDYQRLVKERELSFMALKDMLTELPNGNQVDLSLRKELTTARQNDSLVLLMLINLDGFRGLNEFLGWSGGNQVLCEVGKRLKANLPDTALLARRTTDEFAVVTTLKKPQGAAATLETPIVKARQIADFLLNAFSKPFDVAGQQLPISASIGVSVFPDHADSPEEMLETAYSALATAKDAGGAQFALYNDKIYTDKEHRAGLAAELKQTVQDGELTLLFRPVVDAARGSLGAAIVEAYWDHPNHGRVDQTSFFPMAEEQGVASAVTEQIVNAACELSRKLRGSIPVILRLPDSVLRQADFAKSLLALVSKSRIRPESLIVELPAASLTRNPSKVRKFFDELAKWRVGRCLGQIGEAPLSFVELQECQPSLLSISEKMMERVPAHEQQKTLVQAYFDAARRLGLSTLVNGTRNSSQAHFLALHEATFVAGDFLSPSLNLEDFVSRRRTTWSLR